MSVEKACAGQPQLRAAIDNGLRCRVVRASAISRWPLLLQKIQAARQAPTQLQRQETIIQLLLRAHSTAIAMKQEVDWKAVGGRDDMQHVDAAVERR